MTRSIRDAFVAFCRAMREAEARFAIVGGFAVSAWGLPRTTQDIAAAVLLTPESIPAISERLRAHGLAVKESSLQEALLEGTHVTVFDEQSIYHVDLVPATEDAALATLRHARLVKVESEEVPIASPEDTIAHKLRFGAEQDLEDARGILARQAESLDWTLLKERCRALGVLDELAALQRSLEEGSGQT